MIKTIRGEGQVVVAVKSANGGWEIESIGELDLERWRRECGAIEISPSRLVEYSMAPPLCPECDQYDFCSDSSHADKDKISAELNLARTMECRAVDTERLSGDILKVPGNTLEEWAACAY